MGVENVIYLDCDIFEKQRSLFDRFYCPALTDASPVLTLQLLNSMLSRVWISMHQQVSPFNRIIKASESPCYSIVNA